MVPCGVHRCPTPAAPAVGRAEGEPLCDARTSATADELSARAGEITVPDGDNSSATGRDVSPQRRLQVASVESRNVAVFAFVFVASVTLVQALPFQSAAVARPSPAECVAVGVEPSPPTVGGIAATIRSGCHAGTPVRVRQRAGPGAPPAPTGETSGVGLRCCPATPKAGWTRGWRVAAGATSDPVLSWQASHCWCARSS
jgi:hypothetical protein